MTVAPQENQLLACLSDAEHERLFPHLEPVTLKLGAVIYERGIDLTCAYFPIDCIISLLSVMDNGDSSEIGMVGNDGVAGISLFMGEGSATGRAVVQSGGNAFRLDGSVLKSEFARAGQFQRVLLRYTQALLVMMSQTAACNKHHSATQQLSRWLLLILDRLPSQTILMTQGLVANMMGVRREELTDVTGALEASGLITFSNGTFTILDRCGLEKVACECYALVRREFDTLRSDNCVSIG